MQIRAAADSGLASPLPPLDAVAKEPTDGAPVTLWACAPFVVSETLMPVAELPVFGQGCTTELAAPDAEKKLEPPPGMTHWVV